MTGPPPSGPLVTVDWLAQRLQNADLVVLDASLRDHRDQRRLIPGAQLFDLDGDLSDPTNPLPHAMPDQAHFEREMRALGVRNSSTVVVYDAVGIYSSARAWWMLRAMGFDRVGVLDGGLPAWIAAGRPCQPRPSGTPPLGDFVAKPRQGTIIDRDAVLAALTDDAAVVLDARSTARFTGRSEEPRPGLRRGHMPGSVNLPFGDLQIDGHLRPMDELRGILSDLVGQRTRLIFSCGSGVTACILALGADLAGYRELAVYDGSWSDWGRPSALPVARTEPEAANP